jgi:glycosyltransferase involved in cell wall biosynthesis
MLSFIIVTYNRCSRLVECLRSITSCPGLHASDEIVLVDDGSTDQTIEVIPQLLKSITSIKCTYIRRANEGCGAARTAGCQYANNPWLVFIDDDAKLRPQFITTLKSTIQRVADRAACIGGPIIPYYTSNPPHWFKDEYEIRTWGPEPRWLLAGEVFSGSNMAWKRQALLAIGAFRQGYGMRAGAMGFGEDTQAFLKGWEKFGGPCLYYYNPTLIVEHWCPAYKFDSYYKLQRNYLIAYTHWTAKDITLIAQVAAILKAIVKIWIFVTKAIFSLIKGKHINNVIFEEIATSFTYLGALVACVCCCSRRKRN